MENKKYSLVIGRFQCLPPHAGHLTLINKVLEEGGNVLIGLRKEDLTDKNPYTQAEREVEFNKIYEKEIKEGRVIMLAIPDIKEVVYGREVGWGIREIRLDSETEAISATKIREGKND